MDNLSVASGVVAGLGGALIGLAVSTTPSLVEHMVPETPIEWVEVGAEAILLATEAAILARTLQANRSLNQFEAQASQALTQAADIPHTNVSKRDLNYRTGTYSCQ